MNTPNISVDYDFLMAPDYLCRVERRFADHPDVVMVTGTVLADGIGGPGYDPAEGARLLGELDTGTRAATLTEVYNGYGCNMAVRARPVFENNLRFDEHLPLYSWLEDVDFSRRIAAHGRIVRAADLVGVHLGIKTGRTPGIRLGYSQVSNPVYLARKGTMQRARARSIMWRNILANIAKSIHPEPWVDRRGRLRGNVLAVVDLLRGRLPPQRVLELK